MPTGCERLMNILNVLKFHFTQKLWAEIHLSRRRRFLYGDALGTRYLRQKVVSGTYKWYKISLFTLKRYLCSHTLMLYGLLMRYVGVIPISAQRREVCFFVEYFIMNSKMPRSYLKSRTLCARTPRPSRLYFSRYKIYILLPLSERWNFDWWLIVINIQDTNLLPRRAREKPFWV